MARLPPPHPPGYPHHIIQRGNNRQMIFVDAQDFETMLRLLAENAAKFGVAVHAYVLMDNHFHLLATPSTVEALPLMMQAGAAATCATSTNAMAAAAPCGRGATALR